MKTSMLLLGGSGQLGTELRRLAGERYDIMAPDRSALNFADMDALSATVRDRRPDIVINAVALQVLETCEANFADALVVNAVAVSRLAKAAEATGARFVTISSDYVFDGLSRTPYRETDSANPIQCYGISKLAGERAALAAHPEGAYVIRTCGLYAAQPSRQKGNFVANRLADARDCDVMEVGSDLCCTPTSAADLAAAILRLIDAAPPGLFHLTNAGCCDWATFTAEIFRLAGVPVKVAPVDRRGNYVPRRPPYSVLDCTRAAEFGVTMPPWQEALAAFLMTRTVN